MLMLESASEVAASWEVAKSVMITITCAGILWMCKTLFTVRDDVRDLKRDWKGEDGTNGAKSQLADHDQRLDDIERRNLRIDAVEQELYDGPNRRRQARRLTDIIRESEEGAE